MIKLENYEVMGWEHVIRGMRNPMNSWDKSDTDIGAYYSDFSGNVVLPIGPNDRELMMKLRNAGTDHRKFMRMITVYVDITAPLYWWKEFDTYKVGTVANSCSTMHKIHEKEFTLEDFSCENLRNYLSESDLQKIPVIDVTPDTDGTCVFSPLGILEYIIIPMLNKCRELFLETKDKKYWQQMIQLLPTSYNQKRTVMLNYEVLANMYKSRKNHKLDEWRELCQWIEGLPYSELITGEETSNDRRKSMKKIPTLFKREFDKHRIVGITDEITPGCERAFLEGVATVKMDGSCCAIIDGVFYKRYDARKGKTPPEGAIPCCDPDPVTGHWPHWVPVKQDDPADRWFAEAFHNTFVSYHGVDRTFEALGPHFNGNPHEYSADYLEPHGDRVIKVERTFEAVKQYLTDNYIEGIVFWLDGEPVCKIKRSDFGLPWGRNGGKNNG